MRHGTNTSTVRLEPRAPASLRRYLAATASGSDPNDALAKTLSLASRRRAGAFFTSAHIADRMFEPFKGDLTGSVNIADPSCGAGDLLLAFIRGTKRSINFWESRLFGRDLVDEFVATARLRLATAAAPTLLPAEARLAFPGVRTGCALTSATVFEDATHLVMNPPFTLVRAPAECEWRTGRVSAAALFMERAVQLSTRGTKIAAILPDVLRSGSGYQRWRDMISSRLQIKSIEDAGTFARWADIDVFMLHGVVTAAAARSWRPPVHRTTTVTLGDKFDVSVGSVVDYRSPKQGNWQRYLDVDSAPVWNKVASEQLPSRRFKGTVAAPPFVVVRRTSRVGDTHRMVGTLVTGNTPVAVENHLLILSPKRGGEPLCNALLEHLQEPSITSWLNRRIRCRHLTVAAVREVRWQ